MPGPVVTVIAQVISHLRLERGLQDPPGQAREQPARPGQLDPLTAGGSDQFICQHGQIRAIRRGPALPIHPFSVHA